MENTKTIYQSADFQPADFDAAAISREFDLAKSREKKVVTTILIIVLLSIVSIFLVNIFLMYFIDMNMSKYFIILTTVIVGVVAGILAVSHMFKDPYALSAKQLQKVMENWKHQSSKTIKL